MAVTIYDLAKAADCSISTVSKALNGSYTVSEATKEKIRALAEELEAAHEDGGRAPRVLLETEFVVGATTAAPSASSAG